MPWIGRPIIGVSERTPSKKGTYTMFKTATLIVALGVTPVFATSIVEADQVSYEQKDSEYTSGVVTNVDTDDNMFTIETSDGEQKQITYGDRTAFLYDSDG